jgi:CRP-like cAMP-binding protein
MDHLKRFYEAIESYQPFTEAEKRFFAEKLVLQEFKSGEYFVKEGQHSSTLAFILDGYMRKFHFTETGEENTLGFDGPLSFAGSYYSFYRQQRSFENIQAISDCTVFILRYEDLQTLYADSFNMNVFSRKILENACVERELWLTKMVSLPSAERYEWFLQSFKDVFTIAQQQHIASFLGIKPETLSRIRRKSIS